MDPRARRDSEPPSEGLEGGAEEIHSGNWTHVLGAAALARRRVALPPPPPPVGPFTIVLSLIALVVVAWLTFW